MRPRIGELFAGYGGLGMGVQAVYGGEVAWVSEFDKGPSKILAHRFPGVPNHGDITKIDWSQVEPVDILTGGSPCQDLSHAGRRAGMTEGTRSNLWVAMREAIAQLRPPMVVWENVGGAFSAAADSEVEPCAGCVGDGSGIHLRALGRVLGDLSSLGYDASWHALRAADVGAPHGRLRVFVVATDAAHDDRNRGADAGATGGRAGIDDSWPCKWCADGLQVICGHGPASDAQRGGRDGRAPDSLGLAVERATSAGSREATRLLPIPRSSDTNGAGAHGEGGIDLRTAVSALLPTPTTTQRGTDSNLDTRDGARANLHNEVARLLPTPSTGESLTGHGRRGGKAGNGRQSGADLDAIAKVDRWGDYAAAIARWEAVLGRPAPAPTMTSSKGNPQLSPAFVEWMMGLPEGWVTDVPGITRNEALKALGNGVVPQQAAEALRVMAGWTVAA